MPIEIAGNQPGYKVWAIVSSACLAMMCLMAGACLMHSQGLVEQYDMEVNRGLWWGLRIGLPGLAVLWCGYMGLLAWGFLATRFKIGSKLVMLFWLFLSCWCSLVLIAGWYRLAFGGMRSVM